MKQVIYGIVVVVIVLATNAKAHAQQVWVQSPYEEVNIEGRNEQPYYGQERYYNRRQRHHHHNHYRRHDAPYYSHDYRYRGRRWHRGEAYHDGPRHQVRVHHYYPRRYKVMPPRQRIRRHW